jgi:hypothetical protein
MQPARVERVSAAAIRNTVLIIVLCKKVALSTQGVVSFVEDFKYSCQCHLAGSGNALEDYSGYRSW